MSNIKVKSTSGGTEYIQEVDQVQLNQDFGASLSHTIDQINENFKKIISLPFLQGDNGNSVFEVDLTISDSDPVSSKLKEAICQEIYGTNSPSDAQFGGSIKGKSSWGNTDGTKIVFYRHKETTESAETYFYATRQFFIFIDNRIDHLWDVSPSVLTSFKDLSCAVTVVGKAPADPATGQPDTDNISFTATRHNIVPTLYYDSDKGYWCWYINGTPTGVIAQGVKGNTGASTKVYICVGQKIAPLDTQTVNGSIKLTKILQPNRFNTGYGNDGNQPASETDIWGIISDDSLVLAWFIDDAQVGNYLNNCTFGLAKSSGAIDDPARFKYINISDSDNIRLDFATTLKNVSLLRSMNDITHDESGPSSGVPDSHDDPSARGLYVPNTYTGNKIHMLWSELNAGSPEASLGCVSSTNAQTSLASSLPAYPGSIKNWSGCSSIFNVWYPLVRCHGGSFARNLAYSSGNYPTSYAIKDYSGIGESPFSNATIERTVGLMSAITLTDPTETKSESAYLSSSGLYIKRDNSDAANDIPAVYASLGANGKILVENGSITTSNSRIYIGSTATYVKPHHRFENNNAFEDWDSHRWRLENPGVKMVNADAILKGGTMVVSSANLYKAIITTENKILFDYKVNRYLTTIDQQNETKVKDERPRSKDYIGIRIGGYNTIYGSITSNSTDGKATSVLDDIGSPVYLTPTENKEIAFLSGKYGYTEMIENWFQNNAQPVVRATDPPVKLEDNNTTITKMDGNWGLLTSYDCLWTKVGNVVDVKGKIFVNKARYQIGDPVGSKYPITVANESVQPLTYAEIFRHIKRYGTEWAFPLPVIINKGTNNSPSYSVSTGNALDNSSSGNTVSAAIKASQNTYYPRTWFNSGEKYHNDLFNGSAQFHFYGTDDEAVTYSSTVDGYGTNPAGLNETSKMHSGIDLLNNVFAVTADISKSPTYDDRFWCMSGIPNYDVINYRGTTSVTSNDNKYLARYDQFRMQDPSFAPVRIVSYETSDNGFSDKRDGAADDPVAPSYAAKYRDVHAILGIAGRPNNDFRNDDDGNHYSDRYPTPFYNKAGKLQDLNPIGNPNPTAGHQVDWLFNNYINNMRSYKISVNIGSYFVRYISFAFSYILDDDIQTSSRSTSNGVIRFVSGTDDDNWILPGNRSTLEAIGRRSDVSESVTPGSDDR